MDRHILVIGANGGLASATIKHLLNDGYRNIVMACRTLKKGEIAKSKILNEIPSKKGVNLSVVDGFDMNDPLKIEEAVKKMEGNWSFDTVFLAAGGAVFTNSFQVIEYNGKKIERNVFQNMMGSHISLSLLKKHNLLNSKTRVIMSGGEGARGLKGMIDAPEFNTVLDLKKYIFVESNVKYNPMNALGASKFFGALWTRKIAEVERENLEVVWFSPGLTYGTDGLQGLSPAKKWFMKNIMFNIMRLIGQAQSPDDGGRKFANAINGSLGVNGDLLGAPAGKAIGRITDQTPMNPDFSNQEYIDEFWMILEDLFGPFGK